jgi:hypothetical protein
LALLALSLEILEERNRYGERLEKEIYLAGEGIDHCLLWPDQSTCRD